MADPTLQAIYNSQLTIKKAIASLENRMTTVEGRFSSYVSASDLSSEVSTLSDSISDLNAAITVMETKLQKILLPTDTRYYLETSEISNFRSHFRQLRAFMSEVDRTRQALIKLMARYNLTNSSL